MEYVNFKGQPISVGTGQSKAPSKPKASKGPQHKGWHAVGYSKEQVERGRADHEKAMALARERGGSIQPFNIETFSRLNNPEKIQAKPFNSESSARAACELAERTAGWLKTSVREYTTGVKKK